MIMKLNADSIFSGFGKKHEQPEVERKAEIENNIELIDLEKGDKVWCGGNSGFCYDDVLKVRQVSFKFDEDTGDKYKIIHLGDNRLFDSRDGHALNPPTAYYLKPCAQ